MNGMNRVLGPAIVAAACLFGSSTAWGDRFESSHRAADSHAAVRYDGHHSTVSVYVDGRHGHAHRARRHNRHGFHAAFRLGGHPFAHGGHYEYQKILVRPGYYEDYRVHIPAQYDPVTCRRIRRAHYETRTRWIEPTYEYREVWVEHH